jgi:hypothetical protein
MELSCENPLPVTSIDSPGRTIFGEALIVGTIVVACALWELWECRIGMVTASVARSSVVNAIHADR